MEQRLHDQVSRLLASGEVPLVLGHGRGSLPDQVVPAFVTHVGEAASLVWSPRCHSNLAAYLTAALERVPRVGIVAKQCDARAIVALVQEGQIDRDDVVVIGVPCPGVADGEMLAGKCHDCSGAAPSLANITLEREAAEAATGEDPRDAELARLEALPPDQRRAYWQTQLDRCLRCYACRAVCPLCYCDECIAHKHRPQWIPTVIDGAGNTAWNIIRALHLAGRCSGCDECARVCPAGIRLDLLNHKLALEVERHFGYRAGEDPSATPVMVQFRDDDPGEFFL